MRTALMVCCSCGIPRPHYRDNGAPSGFKSTCKQCDKERMYAWRKTEKGREWSRRKDFVAKLRRIIEKRRAAKKPEENNGK